MTMLFFLNREDLLISDFWSLALGGYHLAVARGSGVGGGLNVAKKGTQPTFGAILPQ